MPSTARRYGERTELRWAGTDWMQSLIDKYGLVHANLLLHDKLYPSPDYLKSIVKVGNIEFEGEMGKDTEGSNSIKKILLDNKQGPVYVQLWGGTNTLARALKSIEDEYKDTGEWQRIYKKVSEKTIIYTVLDQDSTYAKYVSQQWRDIKVIYNSAQFWSFAYMWTRVVPENLKAYLGGPWFADNIKFKHGPLLENYYLWGDGLKIAGDPEHTQGNPQEAQKQKRTQYDFISEGDSPAYFFLLNYGLRNMEDPSFGGLGGRFIKSANHSNRWEDGINVADFDPFTGKSDTSYPQVRWIEALQNDFAARADWCVKSFKEGNHPPVAKTNRSMNLEAKPGDKVRLSADAADPDGNALTYSWWQYKEAGTLGENVTIEGADSKNISVVLPTSAERGKTIHLILEVRDDGSPRLARYQRFIITAR
jgi:hypothetical protein